MMASNGSFVFVINILFGLCISGVFGFEVLRPLRKPISHGIPIRPLDKSTIQRLARRPTELNPDSEPIFLPYQRANRRPLQIMERISVPSDPNGGWNRAKKDPFNVLNFEAYAMKPNGGGPPRPVSDRIYRLINQSDDHHKGDTKSNPSGFYKYRTRGAYKRPKKNVPVSHVKEFDDLEFYKAFLEHQKHAAMAKRLKSKPESSSRLPIGIEFFKHKNKNKMAFPPITYSPLYLNNLHRSQQFDDVHRSQSYEDGHRLQPFDDVQQSQPFFNEDQHRSPTFESVYQQQPADDVYQSKKFNERSQPHENVEASSNVHRVHLRRAEISRQEETSTPTTAIPVVPTTIVLPMDYEAETQAQSQTLTQTIVPLEIHHSPNDPDMYDFGSRPEMYKFTIDDVVVKPQAQRLVKYPFTGPVTLSPAMHSSLPPTPPSPPKNVPINHRPHADYLIPVSANTIHEHRYNGRHHVQMNYPLKNYIRGNYRPYKSMPIQASASSNQQIHKYSPEPMTLTTPIVLPTEKVNNAVSVKAAYEIDSRRQDRQDRRNRRRKPTTTDRQKVDAQKANQQKEFLNNLEFSSSYSKRRTQGYNSDEEVATTPISPTQPKTTSETNRQEISTSTSAPKNEKVKYFQ